jgi:hypothetical protein
MGIEREEKGEINHKENNEPVSKDVVETTIAPQKSSVIAQEQRAQRYAERRPDEVENSLSKPRWIYELSGLGRYTM